MRTKAQGASEYLVLLAVVLVIALVAIALLGFFPGTATDAQMAESQIYWQSASPIAISEASARRAVSVDPASNRTAIYMGIRNAGSYPIRLTGIYGGYNTVAFFESWEGLCLPGGQYYISDYYYMAPGEEKYFGSPNMHGVACSREIYANPDFPGYFYIAGANGVCQNSTQSPGTLLYRTFGFEYVEYVEGQQITKRQIGTKPLIIKCREPY